MVSRPARLRAPPRLTALHRASRARAPGSAAASSARAARASRGRPRAHPGSAWDMGGGERWRGEDRRCHKPTQTSVCTGALSVCMLECFRRVNSGGECGALGGRGGGIHGVRGASRDVLARGPGFSPDIYPPRAPLAPCFHPPETLHRQRLRPAPLGGPSQPGRGLHRRGGARGRGARPGGSAGVARAVAPGGRTRVPHAPLRRARRCRGVPPPSSASREPRTRRARAPGAARPRPGLPRGPGRRAARGALPSPPPPSRRAAEARPFSSPSGPGEAQGVGGGEGRVPPAPPPCYLPLAWAGSSGAPAPHSPALPRSAAAAEER